MAITKINTPELLDINTTGAKQLPSGTTAQRPTTGLTAGDFRYNTDDNHVEYYDGAAWFQIDYEAVAPTCTTDTINYPVAVTAYYKMEDATDQTGNYNGTATSVDFNVQGKFGNAGEFNGSSSKISLNNTAFQLTTYSISLWVNSGDYSTANTTIYDGGLDNDGSLWGGLALGFSANKIFYFGGDVTGAGGSGFYTQTGTTTITNSTWYNVTLIVNGTSITGYINGTQDTGLSRTLGANIVYRGTPGFNLGVRSGSFGIFGYLNGKIDQVRIFPTALTAANVTSLYNEVQCAPTIVPSQNFNVNTYFGNGATQVINAKFNEAANFNGSSSIISVSGQLPSVASDYSISFWANPTTISTSGNTIFTNVNAGGSAVKGQVSVLFYDYNSVKRLRVYIVTTTGSLATAVYDSTSAISTGTFSHIVVNIDINGAPTAYVDGSPFSMSFLANTSVSTQGSDTIFGKHQNASFFNGKIDQVRIFDSALTGNQVTDLYTNETDTTAQLLNFPVGAGCIAAYKLDSNADDISGLYSGTPTDIGYTGMEFQPDFTWIKLRDTVSDHDLIDSVRGATKVLESNNTLAQFTEATNLTSFDSNGFTVGSTARVNKLNEPIVAWNWKAGGAPTATNSAGAGNVPTAGSVKIDGVDSTTALAGTIAATSISANTDSGFSVVDFTTSPSTSDTIAHGLSSPPEMIITKNKNGTLAWYTYHIGAGSSHYLILNNTDAKFSFSTMFSDVNSTTFDYYPSSIARNYIAYCFHSVDGYSKFGSYVGTGGSNTIVTGFKPAFVMVKASSNSSSWYIVDNKRTPNNFLSPDLTAAEYTDAGKVVFNSNGFSLTSTSYNNSGYTWIFMAFAAEPTPEPVLANSFNTVTYTGNNSTQSINTVGFQPDLVWIKSRTSALSNVLHDTLTQPGLLISNGTNALIDNGSNTVTFTSNGFNLQGGASHTSVNGSDDFVAWCWKAGGLSAINNEGSIESIVSANPASGFSVVKWTGNGTAQTIGHGLDSAPELIITKGLTTVTNWGTYSATLGATKYLVLDGSNAAISTTAAAWNNTDPTSSVFSVGTGFNYTSGIAYCFTSISGYQKVGSYTWTGTSYTAGTMVTGLGFTPSFVMIKGTDVTSNWIMYDNQRVSGTQSYALYADLSDAENTIGYQGIKFDSDGFSAAAGADGNVTASSGLNENGKTYIYLAIA